MELAELLSSEIALMAAGLAGLAITSIAILRDVTESRRAMTSASSVRTPSSTIASSA